jgi:glucose/arabinose dehydrogenase
MRVKRFIGRFTIILSILCGALLTIGVAAQDATPTEEPEAPAAEETPQGLANSVEGSAIITTTLPFDPQFLDRLQLPEGFAVNIFAQGLGNVRWMTFAPDGTLFVSRRDEGDVIALADTNADGVADSPELDVVASDIPYVHGLTFNGNQLYMAADKKVLVADWTGGANLTNVRVIIDDLPDGGQHPNRTIAFGPTDGLMYITIGSTCNACPETNPENATILRANPDGSNREIFASGLRNTMGFGWHPGSGAMWGMDHGSDWRGDEQPPEELNQLVEGNNYGWPYCFADQQPDLFIAVPPPGGSGRAAYCQRTVAPSLTYTAHSAPIGMVFYTGSQFPEEYANDAFVAMRGSWNRNPPSGYKIVRIHFDENGVPTEFEDFLTGWLIEEQIANFGRVAGLAIAPDGSLLIAEDSNGIIYRVSYTGN